MQDSVPLLVFDRAGCRAVDRESIEVFGIPGMVLMENAARALAEAAMSILCSSTRIDAGSASSRVLIVCGPGNNGGDGYAAARHLHNRGVAVTLGRWGTPRQGTDARLNHDVCGRMGLPVLDLDAGFPVESFGLVLDCLLGTGLDRSVEGRAFEIIDWMNRSGAPIVAADLPSGLDCDSGEPLRAAIRAATTVSFVGWKRGFLNPRSHDWTGRVIVGDIGAPREVLARHGRRWSPSPATDEMSG